MSAGGHNTPAPKDRSNQGKKVPDIPYAVCVGQGIQLGVLHR